MTKLDQLQNQSLEAQVYEAPTGAVEVERFKLTATHWLLMVLALVTLLFMLFITIARSIQISTFTTELEDPSALLRQSADVKIDALLKLPIGNRTLVLPGEIAVRATAEGFEATDTKIEVARDRNQNFDVVLTRLPGQVAITLSPDVPAKVLLNDQVVGEIPGEPINLPAGRHDIAIDAPLHRPASQSVLVQGKGVIEDVAFTLDPAWATLTINSTPSGATLFIDDEAVGESPMDIKVEEGVHKLTLSADKFKTYEQDFTIFAQQDLVVPDIAMIPADGVLAVTTTPKNAVVILNGEYQGTSPLSLNLKPDAPQQLQIYRAGYRLRDESVTLAPAEEQQADIALQQDSVAVSFSVTPSDAELIIDGVARGRGSKTINLNTLPHSVRARKSGYVDYKNTIIPTKASSQVVSIKLMTKAEHFWANVPNRYSTGEGHNMVLFKSPGKVQLGSSRRETGRRSNETVYSANLSKHFFVSEHEVTNKQFRKFKPQHNSGNYKRRSLDSNKHPVANVTWQDAARYCNWLSKKEGLQPFYITKAGFISDNNPNANGYRLPTEHEWAWLARNKNGELLTFPWKGASAPSGKPIGNFADKNATDFLAFTLSDYDDGYKASSPVGRFAKNHNGLYDMGGNVAEWVHDWYSPNSDLAGTSDSRDWLGPEEGEFHTIRGGSWARGHMPQLRLAYRDFGAKGVHDVGFRIARYVGSPK